MKWLFYKEKPEVLALIRIILFIAALSFLNLPLYDPIPLSIRGPFIPTGIFNFIPSFFLGNFPKYAQISWWFFSLLGLIGFLTRPAIFLAFISGIFVHGYQFNYGRIYHGTHLFFVSLLILAITPCADVWSLDAYIKKHFFRKTGPLNQIEISPSEKYSWGVRLGQINIVLLYLASGIAKVYRSGFSWAWSDNLFIRVVTSNWRTNLGEWLIVQAPSIFKFLALYTLAIELLSPIALLSPFMGLFMILCWMSLHLGIHLLFGAHFPFFSHYFVYAFFFVPIILNFRKTNGKNL